MPPRHSEDVVSQQILATATVGVAGQKTVALGTTGINNLASSNHATGNDRVAASRSVWDKQASVTLPPRMAASFLFDASLPITASRAANAQRHGLAQRQAQQQTQQQTQQQAQLFNKVPVRSASEPVVGLSAESMQAPIQ